MYVLRAKWPVLFIAITGDKSDFMAETPAERRLPINPGTSFVSAFGSSYHNHGQTSLPKQTLCMQVIQICFDNDHLPRFFF